MHAMPSAAPPSRPAPSAPPALPEGGDVGPLGLDRLVAIGTPREHIETLRAVYAADIGAVAERLPRVGESTLHWRRAEDAFMLEQPSPHTVGPTEFVANLQPALRQAGLQGRLPVPLGTPGVGGDGAAGSRLRWIDPAAALGLRGDAHALGGAPAVPVGAGEADRGDTSDGEDAEEDDAAMDRARLVDRAPAEAAARPMTWGMALSTLLLGFAVGYCAGVFALLFLNRTGPGRHWFLIGCLLGAMANLAGPYILGADAVGGPSRSPAPSAPSGYSGGPPVPLPPALRGSSRSLASGSAASALHLMGAGGRALHDLVAAR